MKSSKSFARTAATLLCLVVLASASFAATPLNNPTALAIDAQGNLWVANQGANNILKFNPNYVFQPKATVTAGINAPTGIAFDPNGNLWVVDSVNGEINKYTNGVQNTAATITDGIVSPAGLAIDGLGNIWVANAFSNVTVYAEKSPYTAQPALIQTFTPGTSVYSIAIVGGSFAWGTLSQVELTGIESELVQTPSSIIVPKSKTSLTLAGAAKGVLYMASIAGTVNVYNPAKKTTTQFLNLGAVPPGIAVDSAHGRVYISNGASNTISVYSTAGTLLHTIQ
ncbi:MAG: NHL repeat-containing protein [Candidatus Sulfotelmatobacter sp.]